MATPWISTEGGRKYRPETARQDRTNPRNGTQAHDLLTALKAAGKKGMTVPEIIRLGIAIYTARLSDLRDMGWRIENRHRWTKHPRTGRRMMESVYFFKK